jgi:sarcosine oxidase subunit gamma
MPEAKLQPRSAFDDLTPAQGPSTSAAGLRALRRDAVLLAAVATRAGGDEVLRGRLKERYGLDLPDGPRRSHGRAITAVGVATSAWLFVAEPFEGGEFAVELGKILKGAASVVDQSSAYEVLRLSGPALRSVLAKGVALDFHADAFGRDAAAVTLVEQVRVILWRVDSGDELELDIAVPRSYFGAFWSWLTHSAASVGLALETRVC